MFKDLHILPRIAGSLLDEYLAKGWYRMGQIVFTTDYLFKDEQWFRVFWLRYRMRDFRFTRKQEKQLAERAGFSVEVKPLQLTEELENLYQLYRAELDFEISPSLYENLFSLNFLSDEDIPVYDSAVIEIRQQGKLVAAGVFDKGEKAMSGIINFYDPAYRKYSPGKWLILLKLQYALKQGLEYYYPGYIVMNYPKFDYKLEPGETICEIYDPVKEEWVTYSKEVMERLKAEPENPYLQT